MDEVVGIMTHGLLRQRQKLIGGSKLGASKHSGAYKDIKDGFSGESI